MIFDEVKKTTEYLKTYILKIPICDVSTNENDSEIPTLLECEKIIEAIKIDIQNIHHDDLKIMLSSSCNVGYTEIDDFLWQAHLLFQDLFHFSKSTSYEKLLSFKNIQTQIENLIHKSNKLDEIITESKINVFVKNIFFTKEYIEFLNILKSIEEKLEEYKNLREQIYESFFKNIVLNLSKLYKYYYCLLLLCLKSNDASNIMGFISTIDKLLDMMKLALDGRSMINQYILYYYIEFEFMHLKNISIDYFNE